MRRFCPDRFLLVAILRSRSQLSCQGLHILHRVAGELAGVTLGNWGPELPSSSSSLGYALRLGPIRGLQKRGSDSSVSLLSGAIFRFLEEAPLPVLAFFFGFLSPETWAFAGGASAFALVPFSFRSSFQAD